MHVPQSRHMPCPDCGASVDQQADEDHECDPEQKLDYEMFQLREEVAAFEKGLWGYLLSSQGEFEVFYAKWQRLQAA
jgi:hypothetical protein